ncbi:DNA-deoxyinosine glycosylase [Salipaludibacillus neizhouensis]|uniref:DNA-deoxyinosine glycosylase n=1 Tax=Salipaludibacillus neizhouensis TaxID=885475 RepID=A0A3A9KY98_9BACI|nr:DNA-deoxyinosine glycosylase [Salipaludibacillus neizhouensis]RKL69316.1 DNA-deoxyinosine glycosylase [Salipaludibacillus neizhouensis]
MIEITSMKPVIRKDVRVLILGSMPGMESLKRQQYYGNPRNHFWLILGELFNQELHQLNYTEKITFLHKHKIGVWDVIASCERMGSLDSAIKNEKMNDLASLVVKYPSLQWIGLNGTKAYQSFRKYLKQHQLSISYEKLPSSSPVPGRNVKNFKEKVVEWEKILNYLDTNGGIYNE